HGIRILQRAPRSRSRNCDRTPVTRSSSSRRPSPVDSPNQRKGGREPMTLLSSLIVAQTRLGGQPDPNGLPGTSALQSLISGVAFWALLAALAGLLVSAAVWALSSHSGNYHHASMGRRGTLISALAAFLVGAAPAIIAFFEDLGRTVQ